MQAIDSEGSITQLLAQWSAAQLRELFAEDTKLTADVVRSLAREGLPQAQVCYGRMLLAGNGVVADATGALSWFRRAADAGDIDALNMVGRCLDNGWGTAEDPGAAAVCYQRAADAGHAWAQYNLGHLYLDGRGVARDFDRAYACYLQAAGQQHERAMNLVGRCCEAGWGTTRDAVAAAGWYRRSAERGYFRGQFNWATILLKSGRRHEAATWFERAARGGTPAVRAAVINAVTGAGGILGDLGARLKAQTAPNL
jgi:TPR repeat protein